MGALAWRVTKDHERRSPCGNALALALIVGVMTFPFALNSIDTDETPQTSPKTDIQRRKLQAVASSQEEKLALAARQAAAPSKSWYKPAPVERYVFQNMQALGYETTLDYNSEGCLIWKQEQLKVGKNWTENEIYHDLQTYRRELRAYYNAVDRFDYLQNRQIRDVRKHLSSGICRRLDVLHNHFPSRQLSRSRSSGSMEPLLTPLRHPNFCYHRTGDPETLDALSTDYLVHDFAHACGALKETSRIVLFDLGASPKSWEWENPTWSLVRLWERFGFKFDHIYAFENTDRRESIDKVYSRVPRHLQPTYHWIHSGLVTEPGHPVNPFTFLEQEYTEDDLVLFKMDIGPSHYEEALVQQLISSPKLMSLIDHFYYEHKVHMLESSRAWGGQMIGSVADSLKLFAGLRKRGVAAHHWV